MAAYSTINTNGLLLSNFAEYRIGTVISSSDGSGTLNELLGDFRRNHPIIT